MMVIQKSSHVAAFLLFSFYEYASVMTRVSDNISASLFLIGLIVEYVRDPRYNSPYHGNYFRKTLGTPLFGEL
jgi:hypothetical protein